MSAGVSPVPDEAVERLAMLLHETLRDFHGGIEWADLGDFYRATYRDRAAAALPALREGIAAEVLNDAAADRWARDDVPNRVQTWQWLRERAGNPPAAGSGAESLRAQVAAEVLGPVREDIRDRRRLFARMRADDEYLRGLDDAFRLVSNRLRTLAAPVQAAEHWRCDCVPDIGPAHCHACDPDGTQPVEWPCLHTQAAEEVGGDASI